MDDIPFVSTFATPEGLGIVVDGVGAAAAAARGAGLVCEDGGRVVIGGLLDGGDCVHLELRW